MCLSSVPPWFALKTPHPAMLRRLAASPCLPWSMLAATPSVMSSRLASGSIVPEDPELGEFLDYMERLKNYERVGVPRGAGTDTDEGFDLGRMRRLLERLGNPHKQFRAVHVAGTKGKGSTASFISNILREAGYTVDCYTSPHHLSVREHISVGKSGNPVSASLLKQLFGDVKGILDQSIGQEKNL